MAKHLLTSLALMIVCAFPLRAQTTGNYRVVRVVGNVESSILKRALKTEDVIPDGDHLKFKTKHDYLIIFHPKSGRKKIQGVPDEQPRELNTLIQSFLKPDEKSTGTRAINQAYLEQLKSSFQDKVLILGDGVIELDPNHISLKAPASIKAEYKPENKKSVVVTVSYGQTLRLDKKTLFPTPLASTPKVLLLYFLVNSSSPLESEDFLGNFVPVYVDDATLLPEIKSIAEALKGNTEAEIEKQIAEYLTHEYARPQPQNLHGWLKSNHLLPGP